MDIGETTQSKLNIRLSASEAEAIYKFLDYAIVDVQMSDRLVVDEVLNLKVCLGIFASKHAEG